MTGPDCKSLEVFPENSIGKPSDNRAGVSAREGKDEMTETTKPRRERGTGRIWQIGPIWYIQYSVNGRQVRVSSGSRKKDDAKKLLKLRLAEAVTGTQPDLRRLTYADLRAAYMADYVAKKHKSLRWRKDPKTGARVPHLDKVQRLDMFFEGYKASAIDADLMRRFIARLQANGTQDSTINRSLSALRRMFNIARADKKLRDVPHFPMLKEPKARQGFFEHEKYLALSAALPEYVRPLLAIGYHTGMRKKEILTLRWSQVDFLGGLIRLNAGETKNDEGRKIPIFGELAVVLRQQHARRRADCETVCFRMNRAGRAVPIGGFRKVWEGRCVKLGIGAAVRVCRTRQCSEFNKPLHSDAKQCSTCEGSTKLKYFGPIFHDLRRTGVRNLVRAGVPESVAMAITGHKTRSVFDRYDITSEKDVKDAGSKLETYYAGQKGESSGKVAESSASEEEVKLLPVM